MKKNLTVKMEKSFSKETAALVRHVGHVSNRLGYRAFLVGGIVRDLLLGIKNLDLDIVIEGDAIKVGEELKDKLGGGIKVHKKFGTCKVTTEKGLKIDLATARKEVYEKPAALPTVEYSLLEDDLIRRDFTINAMAVSLNEDDFGDLVDLFGGEQDLKDGRIRILHDASFIDDPTRIFRAMRFEYRLKFSIDKHTKDLIAEAVKKKMLEKIGDYRTQNEMDLIMKEKEPLEILNKMEKIYGVKLKI